MKQDELEELLKIPAFRPEQIAELGEPPRPYRVALADLAETIYAANAAKGFWDNNPSLGARKALIISELSEAVEAFRSGEFDPFAKDGAKPVGELSELVDVFIRAMDVAGRGMVEGSADLQGDRSTFSMVIDTFGRSKATGENEVLELYFWAIKIVTGSNRAADWGVAAAGLAEYRGYTIQDFFKVMIEKLEYNKTRPHKHGKSC